jgi:hypothetical protein
MLPPERMSHCPRNSHADIGNVPNVTILVTLVLFAYTESGYNCRPGKHCTRVVAKYAEVRALSF